jgi:type VI secretion system protein ImpH
LQYEAHYLHAKKESDIFTHALASLAGFGTLRSAEQLPIPIESLLGYSGLYARPIRSASALKSMLQHYFELRAEVEQFCGQWQDLADDVLTRLAGGDAGPGCNNTLGVSAIIGKSCWQAQSKFRIKLAPMNYDEFMTFVPGGRKLKTLQGFITFFAGTELDYEIEISLDKNQAHPARLSKVVGKEPLLGWNTPLGQTSYDESTPPINILVSKYTTSSDAGLPTAI